MNLLRKMWMFDRGDLLFGLVAVALGGLLGLLLFAWVGEAATAAAAVAPALAVASVAEDHYRDRRVRWRYAIMLGACGGLGTWIGVLLA